MEEGTVNNQYDALLIGGSAGSLTVLIKLLPALRDDLDLSIIIVIHRNDTESVLVDVLGDKVSWPVREAEEKEPILKKVIYLAPGDYHLLIEKDLTFSLDYSEKIHFSRPAIDATFETAAEAYGRRCIGLLLSGANSDGTDGLKQIKSQGGLTIVQNPTEASVSFMPQYAIDNMQVDYVATTTEIIDNINRLNQDI